MVLRLAVYMPDGSAPIVQPVWISDEHGRRGKIEINSWTGLPSFERVVGDDTVMPEEPEDSAEPEPEEPVEDFQPASEPPATATPAPDDEENQP